MPATKIPVLTLSILATADIAEGQAVGFDGAVAAPKAPIVGIAACDAKAGDQVAVDALGTAVATHIALIPGIAVGDALEIGDAGGVVPDSDGVIVARALQAAAADGDRVEVLLTP